jgi:hypothetical protein
MSWATDLFKFYRSLRPSLELPNDVVWLYPQKDPVVMDVVKQFLDKYYNDSHQRRLLFGINPGRFGAGVTGVNFTAPRQLSQFCGIDHPFKDQSELSAEFIYDMIDQYGGPEKFYRNFFITSVCPLGFIKHGKNINYYDDRELLATVEPFIISAIEKQLKLNVDRDTCYSIGGEKNCKYLNKLNQQYNWFGKIIPLAHPRFIMQYRRKKKQEFIDAYIKLLC